MRFCILLYWYWFLVIIKILKQTAVRKYQKKISDQKNSINLNIRTLSVAFKSNIRIWVFVNIRNTDHSFGIVGVGGKKESVQHT
jgi:hypothetical protein